jgi:hypothetical protein
MLLTPCKQQIPYMPIVISHALPLQIAPKRPSEEKVKKKHLSSGPERME